MEPAQYLVSQDINDISFAENRQQKMQSQISLHLLQKMNKSSQVALTRKQSRIQEQVKVSIGVWNLQGSIPPKNSIKVFMQQLTKEQNDTTPDLICISTQECQRSITMSLFCENKQQWENCLKQSSGDSYKMVESETMRALHIAIFVKEQIANCFTTQKKVIMRAGTCGIFGNKGAISIVVNLLGQNFQFINCHLQAHQDQCEKRNQVLLRITNQLVERDYRNQVFICGDLNYRINMTHQQYYSLVKTKAKNLDTSFHYSEMLARDQLILQQELKDRFFPFYKEQKITFPPTYKINDSNQQYDKKRIPGWTDRIFHRKGRAKQVDYRCLYSLMGTDHRPVLGTFVVQTQETLSIFPDNFVAVKGGRETCSLI